VLLAFGFGAGLSSQEISRLVGSDVSSDADGVMITVIGNKARDVPVLKRFEDTIASLAAEAGSGPIFLPERKAIAKRQIPNFIARCPKGDGPRLNMNRLRSTWIVHHLSAGTQLGALAVAAGVDASQLVKYQRYARALDPVARRRQLREAT
jgi:site-specific recombinase XerC